jgi:hypothetical protein
MASKRAAALALASTLIWLTTSAASVADVDLRATESAGLANEKRLASGSAQWTTDITLPGGAVAAITTLRSPSASRYVITLSLNGQSEEFVRVVERDGVWYVKDERGHGKYRPYEYPGENSLLYLCLVRSAPAFLTAGARSALGTVTSTERESATFSAPLHEAVENQVKNLIAQMEQLASAQTPVPEAVAAVAQMKSFLARGIITSVDLSNGLITENRSFKLPTATHDFRFLDRVDSAEFAVPGNWDDNTADPTLGDTNDLLMISHYPGFVPGMKNPDVDGVLFNLKTGKFRRLPYRGSVSMPGCFLPGRTRVVVSGVDITGGPTRPYILDLKTGENQPLGGALLDRGMCIFESLSPDAKHLACGRLGANKDMLKSDVVVIDLASGDARFIGKPMDVGAVYWTPDGRLLLLRRETRDMNGFSKCFVSIMDLDGNVTDLRRGDQVTPLADNRRILFEDEQTRLWHTCDYQGLNDSLFGDGLAHYGFPSPAPDGKRILMIHFIEGGTPIPTVIPIDQSSGTPLTEEPGLWTMPRWP